MTKPKWSKELHTNLNWVLKVEAEEQITHLKPRIDNAIEILKGTSTRLHGPAESSVQRVIRILSSGEAKGGDCD